MFEIGFIGLGKLGLDAAEVLSKKHNVTGYDIESNIQTKIPRVNSLELLAAGKDLIFIAVPTPHDPAYDGKQPTSHLEPKDFDYTIVENTLKELDKHCTKDQLVILISTVLPGTIRKRFIPLINNFRFIYNPYLIATGTVKEDMVDPEMVIIGTEDGSNTGDASLLVEVYDSVITNNTRHEIGTWEEAEAIKIFYNTFISTKLALVNMIQDVSQKLGNMDTDFITDALANSTMRIMSSQYMKAGLGDGGSCHPRDNIALRYLAKELNLGYDLFDSIMLAREQQARNIATQLIIESNKVDLPIVILGKSFKPGVPYVDGSPSMLVGEYCTHYGSKKVPIYDPEIPIKAVYLLGHMNSFQDYKFPNGSVVLDPWRSYISTNDKVKVVYYGNKKRQIRSGS